MKEHLSVKEVQGEFPEVVPPRSTLGAQTGTFRVNDFQWKSMYLVKTRHVKIAHLYTASHCPAHGHQRRTTATGKPQDKTIRDVLSGKYLFWILVSIALGKPSIRTQ